MNDSPYLQSLTGPGSDLRNRYYKRIAKFGLAPLWEVLNRLVTPTPASAAVACKWDYDRDVRPLLMEAGDLISAKEAERRVLVLENPGLSLQFAVTQSLYAGFQLVLPGETASAHRHTQSALRFVVEGGGAYTTVNEERIAMAPGDLVITPSWAFHEHGNETDEPMVWLDGLDVPLVRLLDASFFELAGEGRGSSYKQVPHEGLPGVASLAPIESRGGSNINPLFHYPFERSVDRLTAAARRAEPNSWHGYKMRYMNPATGGHVTPTIAAFIQLLPCGMETSPYRSTDGAVYFVVEGSGDTTINDVTVSWGPRDVFVVPSWSSHRHRARDDAILFSFSDRSVQEKLGLWREAPQEVANTSG